MGEGEIPLPVFAIRFHRDAFAKSSSKSVLKILCKFQGNQHNQLVLALSFGLTDTIMLS